MTTPNNSGHFHDLDDDDDACKQPPPPPALKKEETSFRSKYDDDDMRLLQSICEGVSNQRATALLESSNGSLERAVDSFFQRCQEDIEESEERKIASNSKSIEKPSNIEPTKESSDGSTKKPLQIAPAYSSSFPEPEDATMNVRQPLVSIEELVEEGNSVVPGAVHVAGARRSSRQSSPRACEMSAPSSEATEGEPTAETPIAAEIASRTNPELTVGVAVTPENQLSSAGNSRKSMVILLLALLLLVIFAFGITLGVLLSRDPGSSFASFSPGSQFQTDSPEDLTPFPEAPTEEPSLVAEQEKHQQTNSCFEISPLPGCKDEICQQIVCAIDPNCCTLEYDSVCIQIALDYAEVGAVCVHDWPSQNNSCLEIEPFNRPGCSNLACQHLVCAIELSCCTEAYEETCVQIATWHCPSDPEQGIVTVSPTESVDVNSNNPTREPVVTTSPTESGDVESNNPTLAPIATITPTESDVQTNNPIQSNATLDLVLSEVWEQFGTPAEVLLDQASPQYMAAQWMSVTNTGLDFPLQASQMERFRQLYALVTLYFSTNGTDWDYQLNFLNTSDECQWRADRPYPSYSSSSYRAGVSCDTAGRIYMIELYQNNLRGTLPPEIWGLERLSQFRVFYNHYLTGEMQSTIGQLSFLREISIEGCELSGTIPTELGSLPQLTYLGLASNRFTGRIPSAFFHLSNTLTYLDVGWTSLDGPLPTEIGTLTRLVHLDLATNNFTGTIPSEIGMLTELENFELFQNRYLGGSIPSEIGRLSRLQSVEFYNMRLNGTIPESFWQLTDLVDVHLSGDLSGSLPSDLGNLSKLTSLDLAYNLLSGSIPISIGQLSRLTYFKLQSNDLTGSIPSTIGHLSLLNSLNWSYNDLTGSIPSQFGNLSELRNLKLDNNILNGTLPTTFGQLTELSLLYLYDNELSGSVPEEVSQLSNLDDLILFANTFTDGMENFCTFIPDKFWSDCSSEVLCWCCTRCCPPCWLAHSG